MSRHVNFFNFFGAISLALSLLNVFRIADTFVIGGEDSQPGEFPFFVSVNYLSFNLTLSGGVLVQYEEKQFILTGASRVWVYRVSGGDYDVNDLKLVAGDYSTREESGNEQTRKTNRVIVHPEFWPYARDPYRPQNLEPNLAIIALTESYNFTDFVKPVTLPAINQTNELNGISMGWGGKDSTGNYTANYPILQKLNVRISTHEECLDRYESHPDFHPSSTHLCVEGSQGGNSVCYADVGGPVLSNDGVLQGIVTYPDGCIDVHPEYPDVIVGISRYIEWIENTARDL